MNNIQNKERQQHLREILGKNERTRMTLGELVRCLGLSISVFVRFLINKKN